MPPCPDSCVHDADLILYTVDMESSTIRLRARPEGASEGEYIDVIFRGVLAWHFYTTLMGCILDDIYQEDIETVYADYAGLFEREAPFGWPGVDYRKPADLFARLNAEGFRAFMVTSHYGLYGFVLAKEMVSARYTENVATEAS